MNETALVGFQVGEIISALCVVTAYIVVLAGVVLIVRGTLRG